LELVLAPFLLDEVSHWDGGLVFDGTSLAADSGFEL
jgi:hypothetical protein